MPFQVSSLLPKKYLWSLGAGWFSLLIQLGAAFPALALDLRIAIADSVRQVRVGSSTAGWVRDGQGRALAKIPQRGAFDAQVQGGLVTLNNRFKASQLWVEPSDGGYVWIGDRWYRGRTLLVPQNDRVTAINVVDLDAYLYSVLGSEMSPSWHQEALKAQAVAARSFALYRRQRTKTNLYDLGSTQTWQVYRGVATEGRTTVAAVQATQGEVLTYNGEVIEAVFHSSSGGHTENVEDVWGGFRPYLRAVVDYDQDSPVFEWNAMFSGDDLGRRIGGVGRVQSMVPIQTTPRGSILKLKVVGNQGQRVLTGAEVRKALGLRSTRFQVIPPSNSEVNSLKAQPGGNQFQLKGYGFGHGVGMSQWGAYGLARSGRSYRQILAHYYQGTTLTQIQP